VLTGPFVHSLAALVTLVLTVDLGLLVVLLAISLYVIRPSVSGFVPAAAEAD
jgi:hypothetical protein